MLLESSLLSMTVMEIEAAMNKFRIHGSSYPEGMLVWGLTGFPESRFELAVSMGH